MAQSLVLPLHCDGETPFETLGTGISDIQEFLHSWNFLSGFTITITKDEVKCESSRYQDPNLSAIFKECVQERKEGVLLDISFPSGVNSPMGQAIWLCRVLRKKHSDKKQLALLYELGRVIHFSLSQEEQADLRKVMGWTVRQFNNKLKTPARAFRLYSVAGRGMIDQAQLMTPSILQKMSNDDFEILLQDIVAYWSVMEPTPYEVTELEGSLPPSTPEYLNNPFNLLLDAAGLFVPLSPPPSSTSDI